MSTASIAAGFSGTQTIRSDHGRQERFQILALSGGGFRGLYTATILGHLEKAVGNPIARCFDLIAGTSVGGILALGLALEIPAAQLVEIFSKHGREVFAPQRTWFGFKRASYSSEGLRALLMRPELFGTRVLAASRHRVIVPSINYSTGKPVVFKTPHHQNFTVDHTQLLVDIALATSAAPFFFKRHAFGKSQYVDGGLYANAPGLFAVHEAEQFLDVDVENIHLLSIGTMSSLLTANPAQNAEGGIADWGRWSPKGAGQRLFGLAIGVQEMATHNMLMHRLTGSRYTHLDDLLTPDRANAVALDRTDAAAQAVLISAANERAKAALGDKQVQSLLSHIAPTPVFCHGERRISHAEAAHA